MRNVRFVLLFLCMMIFIVPLPGAVVAGGNGGLIIAGFDSGEMEKGAPEGWELIEKEGTADLDLERNGNRYVLHMKSNGDSSFGIKRGKSLKIKEYPFLNWEWKVAKLPAGADVRKADADDQAIQVYVAFKPDGWPAKLNTPVIGYIWGTECPKDTVVTSQQPLAGKVRYIVLRNKNDMLNTWYYEKRNLEDDYEKLFPDIDGGTPRDIEGVVLYINSHHTKSTAESYIYNVRFSRD